MGWSCTRGNILFFLLIYTHYVEWGGLSTCIISIHFKNIIYILEISFIKCGIFMEGGKKITVKNMFYLDVTLNKLSKKKQMNFLFPFKLPLGCKGFTGQPVNINKTKHSRLWPGRASSKYKSPKEREKASSSWGRQRSGGKWCEILLLHIKKVSFPRRDLLLGAKPISSMVAITF